MREYFYYGPICPSCHSPYSLYGAYSLRLLKESMQGAEYRCENPECQARFVSAADFGSTERGKNFLASLPPECPDNIVKLASKVPLFWKVEPNPVEKAYIEWVTEDDPKGVFVVTWPWNTVKFLPILVVEYLRKNPDKKIVIVEESNDERSRYLYGLKSRKTFEYLASFDPELGKAAVPDEDVLAMINWLKRRIDKLILKKDKGVQCEADINGEVIRQFYVGMSENATQRDFEEDLVSTYGEDAIRRVTKNNEGTIVNGEGFINIKINRSERRTAEMRYEKSWLKSVLLGLCNLQIPSETVRYAKNGSESTSYHRLVFLGEDEENLDDLINSIKPDLIMFQNTDNFLVDAAYSGVKSRTLKRIIDNSNYELALLFSVRPDLRSYYNILKNSETEGRVVFHTWDSEAIMKKVAETWDVESEYSNPLSSRKDEIDREKPIEVDYVRVGELVQIDKAYELFCRAGLRSEAKRAVCDAVRDLAKRVLSYDEFSWREEFFGWISFKTLTAKLSEIYEGDDQVRNLINEMGKLSKQNVLFEGMLVNALKILRGNANATVTLIINCSEIEGLFEQLRQREASSYLDSGRLFVSCWKGLDQENLAYEGKESILISSYMPPPGRSPNRRVFSKLLLIGSPMNVERMRKYMRNRVDKDVTNPVFRLELDDSAPKLLKDAIESAGVPTRAETEDLKNEAEEFQVVDLGNYASFASQEELSSMHRLPLSVGEKATLLLDNNGNAILVPSEGTVLRRKDLKEISAGEVRENDEILVDKRNFVISARQSEIRYLLTNMKNYPIRLGGYGWDGFIKLYEDSTSWIRLIEAVAKKYAEKNGITFDESSKRLSEFLASLHLEAENEKYIRKWWSNYSTVMVDGREYRTYMVERPKANADLGKIYQNIGKFVQDAEIAIPELERTRAAILAVRKLREELLGKSGKHAGVYAGLRSGFEKERQELAKSASIFRVRSVTHVEVVKENLILIPYKILEKGTYETSITSSK